MGQGRSCQATAEHNLRNGHFDARFVDLPNVLAYHATRQTHHNAVIDREALEEARRTACRRISFSLKKLMNSKWFRDMSRDVVVEAWVGSSCPRSALFSELIV